MKGKKLQLFKLYIRQVNVNGICKPTLVHTTVWAISGHSIKLYSNANFKTVVDLVIVILVSS